MKPYSFSTPEDIANLDKLDRKRWYALSMPIDGVCFDRRTLELMDSDRDGRVRVDEVLGAVDFLKRRDVDFSTLFDDDVEKPLRELDDIMAREADLAKVEPSEDDRRALAKWEQDGKSSEVAILGEKTAAAEKCLAKVEPVIDSFFRPPDDMPLVTETDDVTLPLKDHLNPKYAGDIFAFDAECVKPLLGEMEKLTRTDWLRVKGKFAAYRAWVGSKPVVNAGAMELLVEKERVLRYRLHLLAFLENFVNMRRLYRNELAATFQVGVLRIDAREMHLCFHVANEAAHAALAEKSKCCVVYAKLTRADCAAPRTICAAVTAGRLSGIYVGRNGVFYDRDGKDWDAVVTKVVENQISLAEAFWAPWRKVGEVVSGGVKKFLGDRQSAAQTSVSAGTKNAEAGGAALASSVAAIGIGVGMVGAACASLIAAVKGMDALHFAASIVALVALVSLPSVILTWFKLRKRDLSAILNACGWAVNRPMRFSSRLARRFTVIRAR